LTGTVGVEGGEAEAVKFFGHLIARWKIIAYDFSFACDGDEIA
jgi:hypothetical protein